MIRIILCGCAGRMGREIIAAAEGMEDLKITFGVEAPGHRSVGGQVAGIPVSGDLGSVLDQGDVMVDFTGRSAAIANLDRWSGTGRPCVIGSTGFTDDETRRIKSASDRLPVFLAPNLSIGVNHLYRLVSETASKLADFEIEIVETHHRGKRDAPSGTAREICRIIREVRPGTVVRFGREGDVGERKKGELGVNSVRGGDVVGEHRVLFFGAGEFIELRHFATSRRCFAQGCLYAVRFLVGKPPGLYGMKDLLSIDNK